MIRAYLGALEEFRLYAQKRLDIWDLMISAASRLIKNHSSNHDVRYNDFAR